MSNLCSTCQQCLQPGQIFTSHNNHVIIDYQKPLDCNSGDSKVFEGKICGNDDPVAVKIFVLESKEKELSFENECLIMQTFAKRDNFVHFHDFAISGSGQRKGYLVMEKCEATFQDIIDDKFYFPVEDGLTKELQLIMFMKQILTALSLLATSVNPVAHRDLKPDNIFIKENKREGKWLAKIGDFGLGKNLLENTRTRLTTRCWGHLNYLAPELLDCIQNKTQMLFSISEWHAIDMFALGCCFSEIITGKHLFGAEVNIPPNIIAGVRNIAEFVSLPFHNAIAMCNLVFALTEPDPTNRPTAAECLNHILFEDSAKKPMRQSHVNAVLRDLKTNIPDHKHMLEAFDATSALIIGGKANWMNMFSPDFFRFLISLERYDITKASSLWQLLRNFLAHVNDQEFSSTLKEDIFGRPHLSSEEMFQFFSQKFPFLECHDMIFASEVLDHPHLTKFASVQKDIEQNVMKKGMLEGFVEELSVHNTIRVVTESGATHSLAVMPSGNHVSPLIKIKGLRQAVIDAGITEQDFRLLNNEVKRLKEPIFENAQIYLEESKTRKSKERET